MNAGFDDASGIVIVNVVDDAELEDPEAVSEAVSESVSEAASSESEAVSEAESEAASSELEAVLGLLEWVLAVGADVVVDGRDDGFDVTDEVAPVAAGCCMFTPVFCFKIKLNDYWML